MLTRRMQRELLGTLRSVLTDHSREPVLLYECTHSLAVMGTSYFWTKTKKSQLKSIEGHDPDTSSKEF